MSKKSLIILGILVLLGLAGYYIYTSKFAQTPEEENIETLEGLKNNATTNFSDEIKENILEDLVEDSKDSSAAQMTEEERIKYLESLSNQ
jgi:predicted negative regulator of RcsB-dependent stress response